MKEFLIDKELRDLLPPLTKEEFEQLESNILKDGCQSPIITWNNYIVDGHNRYNICTKHNIEFEELVLAYNTKDEIIQWMIDTQLGRRNLTPIQRIAIAEKYRPIIEKKAKENQVKSGEEFGKGLTNSTKPIDPINTRDKLAKIAGVGQDTYYKGKRILESDNDEIKDKLKNKEISINRAYNELFKKDLPKKEEKATEDVDTKAIYIINNLTDDTEQSPTEAVIKTNDLLKDINGNTIPITDEGRMSNEEFGKMLKDIKTPKNIEDFISSDIVISDIEQLCDDFLWGIDAKLFTLDKAILKLDKLDKIKIQDKLEQFINNINEINNKLMKDGI